MDKEKIHPGCLGSECGSYAYCNEDPELRKFGCVHYIEGDFEEDD